MAIGSFDDFTDKFGFNDGGSSEPRDFMAREGIVRGLNKLLKNYRAIEFDRPGMHNGCMIVFAPAGLFKGTEASDVIPDGYNWEEWRSYEGAATDELDELGPDSDGMHFDIEELIGEIYAELGDDVPPGECYGQAVVDRYLGDEG